MDIPDFLQPIDPASVPPAAASSPPTEPTGGSPPGSDSISKFVIQLQKQDLWCWAAVTASVVAFYNGSKEAQCAIAAAVLPAPNDCCKDDLASCNKEWNLDQPLRKYGVYKYRRNSSIGFEDLQAEIKEGRPLCCRIGWKGKGGHFVVVGGWSVDQTSEQRYIDVYDPALGVYTSTTYDNFCTAYVSEGDQWTHSYFTHVGGGAAPADTVEFDPSAPSNA